MRYVHSVVAATLVCLVIAGIGWADEPRSGQVISLDVLVADVAGSTLGEGEVTAAKVLELARQGKLDSAARITTTVLENTPAVVMFSESVPVATGRQDFAGGGFGPEGVRRGSTNYVTQNHGTTIQTTARIEQGGTIVLELQAERSRLVSNRPVGERPVGERPAGEEAGAANIAATKTTQARVNTTTRVAGGKATIVGSQTASVGSETIHTYFVLTATVPEGARAAAAADPAAQIKIVSLSHARAAEIVKTLQVVLQGQRIRLGADERSNSVIAQGSAEALDTAIALISRLDEE